MTTTPRAAAGLRRATRLRLAVGLRLAAALCLLAALASPAEGAGELQRFALVAGSSRGGPGRAELRYAVADARRVAQLLHQLAGVEPRDLLLLEEPDGAGLRGALGRLAAEAERARAAGRRPELFLYYSGHSNEEGLLLGREPLAYGELRKELHAVPAQVRVAILDSCASGAFTRRKGGVHRPPFLMDASQSLQGHAFLTSSAADEASQESDQLRASFFTHALLTGLRGAADRTGDGLVTLTEAYQFAFQETLARTETTRAGPQHATYDIGLQGSGDVVLTDLRRSGATLVLPEPLAGRVFVRSTGGHLVAELRKVAGARTELGLEPGRYEVRLVRGGSAAAGTVELWSAEPMVLDERGLADAPLVETIRRGDAGSAELRAPELAPPRDSLRGRSSLAAHLGVFSSPSGEVWEPSGVHYAAWQSDRWAWTVSGDFGSAARQSQIAVLGGARYNLPVLGSPAWLWMTFDLAAGGCWVESERWSGSTLTRTGGVAATLRLGAGLDLHLTRNTRLELGASLGPFGLGAGLAFGLMWGGT